MGGGGNRPEAAEAEERDGLRDSDDDGDADSLDDAAPARSRMRGTKAASLDFSTAHPPWAADEDEEDD